MLKQEPQVLKNESQVLNRSNNYRQVLKHEPQVLKSTQTQTASARITIDKCSNMNRKCSNQSNHYRQVLKHEPQDLLITSRSKTIGQTRTASVQID